MMTSAQQREEARRFINEWKGKGNEDEHAQKFWTSFLGDVLGVDHATSFIDFEKKVKINGNTKKIDGYIKETKVLIENKGAHRRLDKKYSQSEGDDLTPYEQAKNYANHLPADEMPRWIVTCNFQEFWIYDLNKPGEPPVVIYLTDLQKELYRFDFLINKGNDNIDKEMDLSIQAGQLVGKLYDALLKEYIDPKSDESLKSLNALCVRLVFCLYAEDADVFGRHGMFHDYLEGYQSKDIRDALIRLFDVLNTKPENRDPYLSKELKEFPYVNGSLFDVKKIEIPQFTDEIKEILLKEASAGFDWSGISPTIFGAAFESTLNPETRRVGGMHYTSVENIHKVIDPLFMNELYEELEEIKKIEVLKNRVKKLDGFHDKLASLTFFDPACGSGNFLTESYISLRRLENEVLKLKIQAEKGQVSGQIVFGDTNGIINPIRVSIGQFYGIEINDFAVTVARTALWIAESQMIRKTEDVVHMNLDFLPLKSYPNIKEGNALRTDWNDVIAARDVNYIMGNPPFVGYKEKSDEQKADLEAVCLNRKGKAIKYTGSLDYVSGWYYKAAQFIVEAPHIRVGFVSTNSITQGEQVSIMWRTLVEEYGIRICFAYRTFDWGNEVKDSAKVHCVIIAFHSDQTVKPPFRIYEERGWEDAEHINAYLINGSHVWIESRRKPICDVKEIKLGVHLFDDHNFIFKEDEKNEFLAQEPGAEMYFKKWISASDFLYGKSRYYLDVSGCSPKELKDLPLCRERVQNVMEYRRNNKSSKGTALENNPFLPKQGWKADRNYLAIPNTSSFKRKYLPTAFMTEQTVITMPDLAMPDGGLYEFGILSSNVHMAWIKTVCGRMKSDYRYANGIVYNNFPWPNPTDEQRQRIEKTAEAVLKAREKYVDTSLAEMYGEDFDMYFDLVAAHRENDRAVMDAYGFPVRETSEADCVAKLFELYQAIVLKEEH